MCGSRQRTHAAVMLSAFRLTADATAAACIAPRRQLHAQQEDSKLLEQLLKMREQQEQASKQLRREAALAVAGPGELHRWQHQPCLGTLTAGARPAAGQLSGLRDLL